MSISLDHNIIFAFIVSIIIATIAGYLGSLMVTKRMALMGDALGHLTLPGAAIALIYGLDISLGSVIFLIPGIFLIWFFQNKTKLPTEAITAIIIATALSSSFLFLPLEEAEEVLVGNIKSLHLLPTILIFFISTIIFYIIQKNYKQLVLITISKDLAQIQGIKINKLEFIYLLCIGLSVALGVRIVGSLMTAALLVIPACTSKNISKSLMQYSYISMILGAISCLFGLIFSIFLKIPAGPIVILTNTILFLVSIYFVKKK